MPVKRHIRSVVGLAAGALALVLLTPSSAFAWGDDDGEGTGEPGGSSGSDTSGSASGKELMANVSQSRITITHSGGGTSTVSTGELASVDPNWEPPACWYEPVMTPEQLKAGVDRLKKSTGLGAVNAHLFWNSDLFVDQYETGKAEDGYKNYNLGEDGYFWRSVVREGHEDDIEAWDCERVMFWQDAGTVPDDPNAPTPDVLAAYAYDKIRVPDTKVEMKPETRSTVNLPTWAWLDKGTFQEVKVRAELPGTGLWAETTAKPIALHLEPGTDDAETYSASGNCEIDDGGSIGTPYAEGDADETPPCGIKYLRASSGEPYQLKTSITWEISWEGSGGSKGDLPNGTFETTQDMAVQEIQSINR
ncbi:hypothetical protein ACFWP7_30000 [Streptomyces sp. NPDC058470]|uniref:hypothetical protein n=1 Tax=Streptomyces sp. NPDC058470 TaxID=3346515 RepID=UPI00365CC418